MTSQQKNIIYGRISNAIGQENIDRFNSFGIEKYGVTLTLNGLLEVIGIDNEGHQIHSFLENLNPYHKIYFFEDYYYYKSFYKGIYGWGIGKDSDKREHFEPYEE